MIHHITARLSEYANTDSLFAVRLIHGKTAGMETGEPVCLHDEDDEYDVLKALITGIEREEQDDRLLLRRTNELYLVDGHMHLEYGPLTSEYVLQFIEEAVRKGLDEIDILDHSHRFGEFRACYEHLRCLPQQDEWLNGSTKFASRLEEYDRLIAEVRKMKLPLRVRFGLEVCYNRENEEMIREILSRHHYDFLTGAVHSVDHILYDMPFSRHLLWEQRSADEIYRQYYREVISCVESGLFDRLAHPDTIKLFAIYPSYDLTETYQQLCRALNENHVRAENNTGCHYRYHHPDVGLSDQLLNIFKENDVRIITASDAHKPEHVGSFIREAMERSRK